MMEFGIFTAIAVLISLIRRWMMKDRPKMQCYNCKRTVRMSYLGHTEHGYEIEFKHQYICPKCKHVVQSTYKLR
jgi:Zn finger protein HypA/HybF involved in hydrogenase expression